MFALRLALGGKSRGAAKKKPAQGGLGGLSDPCLRAKGCMGTLLHPRTSQIIGGVGGTDLMTSNHFVDWKLGLLRVLQSDRDHIKSF